MPDKKPRVFIVHEPLKFDRGSGQMRRWADLTPASEFGELIFILPPGQPPIDPRATLPKLQEALKDFSDDDHLLAIGQPALLAWAAAIAARAANGRIRVLVWQTSIKRYTSIAASVWNADA